MITSAAADEESFKGPLEGDGVRVGEYFLEVLFQELQQAQTLKAAFQRATVQTEQWTRRSGPGSGNGLNLVDNALQHPLLDDNGDGVGSNLLTSGGDGEQAAELRLGVGLSNAFGKSIASVHVPIHLTASQRNATLALELVNSREVAALWALVRKPSVEQAASGTSTTQLVSQFDQDQTRYFLQAPAAGEVWQTRLSVFDEPGSYEIFYIVRDIDGDLAPIERGVVYKNRAGNRAPSAFALRTPEDDATVGTFGVFAWDVSTDPDGDAVTYSLMIADDPNFNNLVHRQDGLSITSAAVDQSAGLEDLSTYFWTVEAVDQYGARTRAEGRRFFTDSTSTSGGIITSHLFSSRSTSLLNATRVDVRAGVNSSLNPQFPPVVRPAVVPTLSANVVSALTQDVGTLDVVLCAPRAAVQQQTLPTARGACAGNETQIARESVVVRPGSVSDVVVFDLDQLSDRDGNLKLIFSDEFE